MDPNQQPQQPPQYNMPPQYDQGQPQMGQPQMGQPQMGQPMMYPPQQGQPMMYPPQQGQPMMYPPQQGQPMMVIQGSPQPYHQGQTVVMTQPQTTTTTVVNVQRNAGDEDVFPALLIFILGWICVCCIWLGGFAYIRSKNGTARALGIASLAMYGVGTIIAIIVIIVEIVAAVSVANSCTYDDYYDTNSC